MAFVCVSSCDNANELKLGKCLFAVEYIEYKVIKGENICPCGNISILKEVTEE